MKEISKQGGPRAARRADRERRKAKPGSQERGTRFSRSQKARYARRRGIALVAPISGLIADRVAARQVGRTMSETLKRLKTMVES